MFGKMSIWFAIATAPIFFWELSLGVWLAANGVQDGQPAIATSFHKRTRSASDSLQAFIDGDTDRTPVTVGVRPQEF